MITKQVSGISIVIPVKNRLNQLQKCISSVILSINDYGQSKESLQYEILIIDDNSDEDISLVEKKAFNIRIFRNSLIGPGAARNLGFQKARYEIVAFIDSDCEADRDWINCIIAAFSNEDIYVVQGNPTLFQKKNKVFLGGCEEKLYNCMFSVYVKDKYCSQLDTRNCAFSKQIQKVFPCDLFTADMRQAQAEARVCGKNLTKHNIRIAYSEYMKVYHSDPTSLIEAMRQKYRHGTGRVYVWDKTPHIGFILNRYFLDPIFRFRVPAWYVIPTHFMFIFGYFIKNIPVRRNWRKSLIATTEGINGENEQ